MVYEMIFMVVLAISGHAQVTTDYVIQCYMYFELVHCSYGLELNIIAAYVLPLEFYLNC